MSQWNGTLATMKKIQRNSPRGLGGGHGRRTMRDRHVGDVIVVDERETGLTPIGIVTDRDLVVYVLAERIDPGLLRADDLLRGELVTIDQREGIYDAIWHMRSKRVRRLPVVDAQCHLVGMLTMDDVTRFLAEELSDVSRIVPRQIEREEGGGAAPP